MRRRHRIASFGMRCLIRGSISTKPTTRGVSATPNRCCGAWSRMSRSDGCDDNAAEEQLQAMPRISLVTAHAQPMPTMNSMLMGSRNAPEREEGRLRPHIHAYQRKPHADGRQERTPGDEVDHEEPVKQHLVDQRPRGVERRGVVVGDQQQRAQHAPFPIAGTQGRQERVSRDHHEGDREVRHKDAHDPLAGVRHHPRIVHVHMHDDEAREHEKEVRAPRPPKCRSQLTELCPKNASEACEA